MQHGYFQKKKKLFWHFDTTPGVEGALMDKTIVCMMLYASFPLIWYDTWPIQKKNCFDLLTPLRGRGACKDESFACMLSYISWPLIWHATWLYSEKVDFSTGQVNAKVTVTHKWYATLRHPKMHPHTQFAISTSNNIWAMLRTWLF